VNRKQYAWREKLDRSIRYDGYLETAGKMLRKLLPAGHKAPETTALIHEQQVNLGVLAARFGVPIHYVRNYHTEEAYELIRRESPDLGVVWGTNILKESVFRIPRLGSINYHQGLAPYYRGGPPVFWELHNNEPEVGVTVHFVESKVDTGDILAQVKIPLTYDYEYGLDYEAFIADYRKRLVAIGVNLMVNSVKMIAEGIARPWPQDISLGKRYRLPLKSEKDELRRRLRQRRQARSLNQVGIAKQGQA
jgi:methionyl-tRNA formyltransferase